MRCRFSLICDGCTQATRSKRPFCKETSEICCAFSGSGTVYTLKVCIEIFNLKQTFLENPLYTTEIWSILQAIKSNIIIKFRFSFKTDCFLSFSPNKMLLQSNDLNFTWDLYGDSAWRMALNSHRSAREVPVRTAKH